MNWNGWQDTIECLESVFRLNYPNYQVIVCDNASTDGSVDKIKAWAEGKIEAPIVSACIRQLTSPFVQKPIKYVEYSRAQAEFMDCKKPCDATLILIQNGANLGFAGGNNVGLRYVLTKDFEYVWLLNNDTVVDPNALTFLVERMKARPDAGICGSTLLYYHEPKKVQALAGGKYNKWLGLSKHVGAFSDFSSDIDETYVESQIDYIVGASMLISRDFLKDVGLLSENYFLYYEELDWAIRAKGKYKLAYAANSIVYHKEGATIGSSINPQQRSLLSDYYGIKNRLLFTKKFFKWALPTVYLGLFAAIINRIKRRQWNRVWMIIEIILGLEPRKPK